MARRAAGRKRRDSWHKNHNEISPEIDSTAEAAAQKYSSEYLISYDGVSSRCGIKMANEP